MKRLYIVTTIFLLLYTKAFTQIYTFQNGEKLNNSYILSETNYAIIIEKNTANEGKTFDIVYKNSRFSGYKDAGIIKILPNETLVATMLKSSLGKDMWVVIYGNIEQEFDSIERTIFSGNNSIIFTRLMDYGIAVINGEAKVQYSELFDSVINDNSYAFSYSRDGQYFININGEEKSLPAKADRVKFSNDGNNIVYVIENEGNVTIFTGTADSEGFNLVDDVVSYNNDSIAYAVKLLPQTNISTNDMTNFTLTNNVTNEMTNEIITNTTTITNYNLSNISVYTNEEGVTVKGQSNTIALMVVTNVITNIRYNELPELPAAAVSTNSIISNEFIMTSVIANGRNYGIQIISSDVIKTTEGTVETFILGDSNFNTAMNSYNNAIATLNVKANDYLNTTYVLDTRCVGSVPNNKNAESENFNSEYDYMSPYTFKDEDTNYKTDYNQMVALGIENINDNYWLASRYVHPRSDFTTFRVRYVNTSGSLDTRTLVQCESWR